MAKPKSGLLKFQVAPRRCVRVLGVDQVHPAVVELEAEEGTALVASGHLINPRVKQELNGEGIDVGLEGKTAGPSVSQGKELPGPDDE